MTDQTINADPGHNAAIPADAVQEWDNEHFVHPWESIGTADADRTIAARAEGIYLYDPDGKKYIDGPGGMWCVQIGYGRREMADAIAEQTICLFYTSDASDDLRSVYL